VRAGGGEPGPAVHGEEPAAGEVQLARPEEFLQLASQGVLPVEVAADGGGPPAPGDRVQQPDDSQQGLPFRGGGAEFLQQLIRWWESLLVPGLLQTADYARALFEAWRPVDGHRDVDVDVAARLARQDIFDRPAPPSFGAVVDESVLYRCIGGAKVMHDQLLHMADVSERPRITVQVLPADVGAHVGLLGAFAIAGFPDDTPGMVYMESPDEGEATKHPGSVARIAVTYDTLRDEALGARASRDLIRKVAEEKWTA
jgi:hypothetical protein